MSWERLNLYERPRSIILIAQCLIERSTARKDAEALALFEVFGS